MKKYYIYIITNKNNSVLYIGITSNLELRMHQHKMKIVEGFSSKYNLNKLIYVEETTNIDEAINREKQLKKWKRQWKLDLIKTINPELNELHL